MVNIKLHLYFPGWGLGGWVGGGVVIIKLKANLGVFRLQGKKM